MSTLAYAYESGYQDGLKAAGTEKQEYERRIDELCQENERLRQRNAKLRELVSDYSDCLDTALWLASDAGYPVMPAQDKFLSLEKRKREMGIEVE